MKSRGKINRIIVEIKYPNGEFKELEIAPIKEGISGIAWNKRILKTVYDSIPSSGVFPENWDADNWEERPSLAVFYTPKDTKDEKKDTRPTHRCILRACKPQ